MERKEYYNDHYNVDHYTSDHVDRIVSQKIAMNGTGASVTRKNTPLSTAAKSLITPQSGLLVPTKTIQNTGIFNPLPVPVVAPKPIDANSPLILAPNVPGGLKTTPSPVYDAAKAVVNKLNLPPLEQQVKNLGGTVTETKSASTSTPPVTTAGFSFGSKWVYIAALIFLVLLYFGTRKK